MYLWQRNNGKRTQNSKGEEDNETIFAANKRFNRCAAPAVTNTQAAAVAKLKELKSLQKRGLITEAQYQAESQKILNQLVE